MADINPFQKQPKAEHGVKDADSVFLAVGHCLSTYEHMEWTFSSLFAQLVAPRGSGYAARRAFGTIVGAGGRRDMIRAASQPYFRNFPSEHAQKLLEKTLRMHQDACARRNEIAHGIIGTHVEEQEFRGYFVVPSTWTATKRRVDLDIDYRYSVEQIKSFEDGFNGLGGIADRTRKALQKAYRSSSEKAREHY